MDTQAADGHPGDKEEVGNDAKRCTCLNLLVRRQGNPIVCRELHHDRADIGDTDVTIFCHHREGIANPDGFIRSANLGALNQEWSHSVGREQTTRPQKRHQHIDMPREREM